MATKQHPSAEDLRIDALFEGKEGARAVYDALLGTLRRIGATAAEPKKTSIHLTAGPGTSAFAGVHPRKAAILLNVRTDTPLAGARIRKTEQVSRNRYHNELLLAVPSEVDDELAGWLAEAHRLSTG
jgi:Domain of unknown function (DUF5655)